MAVGELLIVCDMGDKVEMSSGQSEAAELSPRWHQIETLGSLAPAGQICGHWEHDDPHDTVDTPTPAIKFGGKEKTMMMDKTIYDNQDEDMKSQVTRLCSRASKSPKISLCNNRY